MSATQQRGDPCAVRCPCGKERVGHALRTAPVDQACGRGGEGVAHPRIPQLLKSVPDVRPRIPPDCVDRDSNSRRPATIDDDLLVGDESHGDHRYARGREFVDSHACGHDCQVDGGRKGHQVDRCGQTDDVLVAATQIGRRQHLGFWEYVGCGLRQLLSDSGQLGRCAGAHQDARDGGARCAARRKARVHGGKRRTAEASLVNPRRGPCVVVDPQSRRCASARFADGRDRHRRGELADGRRGGVEIDDGPHPGLRVHAARAWDGRLGHSVVLAEQPRSNPVVPADEHRLRTP